MLLSGSVAADESTTDGSEFSGCCGGGGTAASGSVLTAVGSADAGWTTSGSPTSGTETLEVVSGMTAVVVVVGVGAAVTAAAITSTSSDGRERP